MRITTSKFAAFRLTLLGVLSLGAWSSSEAAGPCAATPAEAVRAFGGEAVATGADGYRVIRVHRDVVLGTRLALIERCGHPEWPGLTLTLGRFGSEGDAEPAGRTSAAMLPVQAAARVVRAGETVRLWAQDANVRLEMAAVCDEAGGAGDRIRVRVTTHQEYGDSVRYVYGLVRGPADVEMVQ